MAEDSSSTDGLPLPDSGTVRNDYLFKRILFYPTRLEPPYSLKDKFSGLTLHPQKIKREDGTVVAFSFVKLFKTDVDISSISVGGECIQGYAYERDVLFSLVCEVLCPMSSEVILNLKYSRKVASSTIKNLTSDNLGIGARNIWYGEPDVRVRAGCSDTNVFQISDGDDEGDSLIMEARLRMEEANLPQVIGMAIISSFTEFCNHRDSNPLVPTILINGSHYIIIMYDSVHDLLLISNQIEYVEREGFGRLALWLTINHRKFLQGFKACGRVLDWKSGFREFASKHGVLPLFENLKSKNIFWGPRPQEEETVVECVDLSEEIVPPPTKRKRTS